MPQSEVLRKQYKSPYPWANVVRRDEDVATDTVFSDTPAVDGGETCAQFFSGMKSLVCDIKAMKTVKQFVNTLEDIITDRGAPNRLISDSAAVETSQRVKAILRALFIGAWQSEPHQQHQNPAERRIQVIKNQTNILLDRTGAPPELWLEALRYVCFLLNHSYNSTIKDIPMNVLLGRTVDISVLLRFHWYQEVYYKVDDSDFPSDSRELKGHMVGIAEHVGHAMTYRIFDPATRKILNRGNLRAVDPSSVNKRLDLLSGEDLPPPNAVIKSLKQLDTDTNGGDSDQTEPSNTPHNNSNTTPVFNPTDLVGRTFLLKPQEDGQRHRARIVEAITDQDNRMGRNPTRIEFKLSINNDAYEEMMAYNDVLDHIQMDEESEIVWKFRRITSHQGPLKPKDKDYKGCKWNVMVEWENGEITAEPLNVLAADDPVSCAIYGRDNNLLELDGWKRFKKLANRHKKLLRLVNQAKLKSHRTAPKYMFGYEVPRDYKHAVILDTQNGNTKWQDCTALEMQQLAEYQTFASLGLAHRTRIPEGYKKIRVHLVYAVKHDGRHKARLVADGHLTAVPLESVYSGVVSLRGIRLMIFLAELNGIETWATDIGNAYLEAKTKERLVIVAGDEFGELKGHLLVIRKALYGLRTSGLRWHERFSQCLREQGFKPCRAEPDIWMRPADDGTCYEYIAVYVDDLAMALKDPKAFVKILQDKYGFKLKGTGPIEYHLGMDFERGEDGVLRYSPNKYIDKMMDSYERLFGKKPSTNAHAPVEPGDHPELDTSEFLDEEQTTIYMSLIGALQWIVSIGRFDVQSALVSLSSFRAAPRRGHLDRVKRIYGYIRKFDSASIRFRTDPPDYSAIPEQHYDWSNTVYGDNLKELKPSDAPPPLGNPVITTSYKDANLMHDVMTGKSLTGILHFVNKTPIDWYSKKQATVETATYGSEFVSARTCVEQIIDLRNTLRYLGVPVADKSYMFGDNESVVNSSTIPDAKLNKRHTMLSFHKVREAIASGMIVFVHIRGTTNPADVLSKHWAHSAVWPLLKPILFWPRDTMELVASDEPTA